MLKAKSAKVDYVASDVCSNLGFLDIDVPQSTHVKYLVWNDGKLHVSYNLRLNFEAKFLGPMITNQVLSETRECAGTIRKFWARYGLDVKINVDSDVDPAFAPDQEVNLHYYEGRADTGNFYWDGQHGATGNARKSCKAGVASIKTFCVKHPKESCDSICIGAACVSKAEDYFPLCMKNTNEARKQEYCTTMMHESGHHLGFPDEYEEKDACPLRKTVSTESNPTSVMNDNHLPWSEFEFFPRHLYTVLNPLCGN